VQTEPMLPNSSPDRICIIPSKCFELLGVKPALSHPPIVKGYQDANREHGGISFRFWSRLVQEGTYAGILIMNEVSICEISSCWVDGIRSAAHTKSSLILCRPEGSDLYSTTPSMSTVTESVHIHFNVARTPTLRNRPSPCYGVTGGSLAGLHSEE
jgi:hypothetical protein